MNSLHSPRAARLVSHPEGAERAIVMPEGQLVLISGLQMPSRSALQVLAQLVLVLSGRGMRTFKSDTTGNYSKH